MSEPSDFPRPSFRFPTNGTRIALGFFILNFLVVFVNLYLSNGYVSKNDYQKDQLEESHRRDALNLELKNIAIELKGINDHMLGDERQDKQIDDLQSRMREQEKKHP